MFKEVIKKIHHWTIPHEGNDHRPHAVRHKTLATYSALMVGLKVTVLLVLAFSFPNAAEYSTITSNRIVELTNQARVEAGLPVLSHSKTLDQSAMKKAQDMIVNNYFEHTSPQGVKPWEWFKQVGYNYTFAGENLAMNFVEAEDAIQAWLDSPTHRENIMSDKYAEIGIAVMVGKIDGQETTIVVQHFGKTFTSNVAGESFAPTSPPIESETVTGPIEVTQQSATQEVKLETKNQSGFIGKLVQYSNKFFLVVLGFVILNLIITIIVRVEVQHKPIILHCFFVIFLALIMIFTKFHFIENIVSGVSII